MDNSDPQPRLVLWGYAIQWAALLMPPLIVVALIYLLVIRSRLTSQGLRSHIDWQLTTSGIAVVLIVIGALLFVVGMSGINTDAPISIIATFILVGLTGIFPVWLLYRVIWGSIQFSRRAPMNRLLP